MAYLVMDGAMSTALSRLGYHHLDHQLWTAKALTDAPDLIRKVHLAYFKAGADCGLTDSYQATLPGLMAAGYSREDAERIITLSVTLFKEARDEWMMQAPADRRYPLCLGSAGPYGAYLGDGSEYRGHYGKSRDELKAFHKRRIELLWAAGADRIVFETVPSLKEAIAEAEVAEEAGVAYWISFVCRDDHHTCEGQSIKECVQALKPFKHLQAIGVNCTNPRYITSLIQDLKDSSLPVFVYPNSGRVYDPNLKKYQGQPIAFAHYAYQWYQAGAFAVGGCCTTDVNDIADIRKARDQWVREKDLKRIRVK